MIPVGIDLYLLCAGRMLSPSPGYGSSLVALPLLLVPSCQSSITYLFTVMIFLPLPSVLTWPTALTDLASNLIRSVP